MKKTISFILLCIVIFWIETGSAFDLWNGEVTTNVNLRKSPGLDGEVITLLAEGDKVVVKDKYGDWYQVVLEREVFGYKGWMHGDFLIKIQDEEKTTEIPIEEVAPTPLEETKPEELPEKKEEIQEPAIEPQEKVFPQESLPEVNNKEKKEPPRKIDTEDYFNYQGTRGLLRLFLRLSYIVLSCFALVFAFKAYRLAKVCYKMTLQLQHNMQDIRKNDTKSDESLPSLSDGVPND